MKKKIMYNRNESSQLLKYENLAEAMQWLQRLFVAESVNAA